MVKTKVEEARDEPMTEEEIAIVEGQEEKEKTEREAKGEEQRSIVTKNLSSNYFFNWTQC